MAAVHQDVEVGLQEGMLWLPSYVLDDACDAKVYMSRRHQNHLQHRHRYREPQSQQLSKCSWRRYQRRKMGNGGTGMQAIFLESRQGSRGTGVFLPQMVGTNSQSAKKPVCAPILLPARVVQALHLNVHTVGLQASPRQDPKVHDLTKCEQVYNNSRNKKNEPKDAFKQCGAVSENQSSSPEIFLPKEWTY